MLLGRWGIRDGQGFVDGSAVGTMGLGNIHQSLGVGRKPGLLAAGTANRPPGRPE